MSFKWYRKHEKTFLWLAVGFSVLILGLFASFGDIDAFLSSGPVGEYARFSLLDSDRTQIVRGDELQRAMRTLGKLNRGTGRATGEEDVLAHLMLLADAEAAGVEIADEELGQLIVDGISGGTGVVDGNQYRAYWQARGFASAKEFETALREQLLVGRYVGLKLAEARVVTLDQIYNEWKANNELFDIEAVAIPDADPETVPEPTDEQLRELWDETAEAVRHANYVEPERNEIVFGWMALGTDLATLPAEIVEGLPEPVDVDVDRRFRLLKPSRFPDLEEIDDATRELLRDELRLVALATAANDAFLAAEGSDKAAFVAAMEAHGLTVEDPEGLLSPDELEALEPIGDSVLPFRVRTLQPGTSIVVQPFGESEHVAVVYVEDKQESRPLEFEEATEELAERWREDQRRERGRQFREALEEAARALPEVAEEIAELEQGARERAAARAEGIEDADLAALEEEELVQVEPAITTRVRQNEHRVWDETVAAFGFEPERYEGLVRGSPPDEQEVDGTELFVSTHPAVFRLGVDGVSTLLRDELNGQGVVVRVIARRFPDRAEMRDDPEGMNRARETVANRQAQNEMQRFADPATIKIQHEFEPLFEETAPADS